MEKAQQEKAKLDAILRGLNDEVLHQVPFLRVSFLFRTKRFRTN
jgi:hypothetical protein